jgi:hypothetical protein
MVRDALKKMMEEREKSVDVEGEKEKKELKESWCNGKTACCNFICPQNAFVLPAPLDRPIIHDQTKKKRLEEKKRRHPDGNANPMTERVKKKQKVYSPLTESDKLALEHWNKIQLAITNNPNRRFISKPGGNIDETSQQTLVIMQQSEQLDKQQKQIIEQQRRIQQQAEQIKALVHQQKILIRQCKASGIVIPLSTPSPLTTPLVLATNGSITCSGQTESPSQQQQSKQEQHQYHHSQQQPDLKKDTIITTAKQSTSTSLPASSSSSSVIHHSSNPPPPYSQTSFNESSSPNVTYSLAPPLPLPYPSTSLQSDYAMPLIQSQLPLGYSVPFPQHYTMPPDPNTIQYLGPSTSDFFNPLMPKDLLEFSSQEDLNKLLPFNSHSSMGVFIPPLQDDFDGLPTGCGTGYGLGISDDELHIHIPDMSNNFNKYIYIVCV